MTKHIHKPQQGIVLITGLIFLLVLTILGISAVSVNTLQERMAGNARDRNLAFQASEAALRNAEDALKNASSLNPTTDCTNGLCFPGVDADGKPVWRAHADTEDGYNTDKSKILGSNFLNSTINTAMQMPTTGSGSNRVSKQPRYIVEALGTIKSSGAAKGKCEVGNFDCFDYYRVSAVGFGKNENTRVEVQDVKRFRM